MGSPVKFYDCVPFLLPALRNRSADCLNYSCVSITLPVPVVNAM